MRIKLSVLRLVQNGGIMKELTIKAENIVKKYKQDYALNQFNIHVGEGEIYALIGQNGAGKTTLIRLIMGLSHADSGDLSILDSANQEELMKNRRCIGTLIEYPTFYMSMTAMENLEINRRMKQIEDKGRSLEILNMVGLENDKKKVRNFSLGMKQRLGIAKALMANPKILILDEPTNGLDPTGIVEFREMIKAINDRGVTILICSHILKELEQIATFYGFIDHGKMLQEVSATNIKQLFNQKMIISSSDAGKVAEILQNKINATCIAKGNLVEIDDCSEELSVNFLVGKINEVDSSIDIWEMYRQGENLETYFNQLMKKE